MLFNSYEFIFLFLPITFFVYFYLNKKRLTEVSKGFLVLSSLFFYSWWNIVYLPIILCSMLFNYLAGKFLTRSNFSNKKIALTVGIVINLLLLGYFKYADFFIENLNIILGQKIDLFHLALPLAISFFTFQQIAYLVDSYKQETKEYDFLNYALFVTFFPQLIAGPIVHHKEMMPQFKKLKNKVINYKNISLGIFIFSIGLFKKVVIADTLSNLVNLGYSQVETLTLVEAWATSLSYTFQLYFDFSGYVDMAIGIALLFNIKLPINFNSPYKALNIQDFWRRWHITLTRFLRDYIYIPLGGNRLGGGKTYRNILTTFLLGGLWHGAGWTFVVWGVLHGIALVVYRIWKSLGFRLNFIIAWFLTFNFVNISWVFFRSETFEQAISLLKRMFQFNDTGFESLKLFIGPGVLIRGFMDILLIILSLFIVVYFKNSNQLLQDFKPSYKKVLMVALFLGLSIIFLGSPSEFLYFRF